MTNSFFNKNSIQDLYDEMKMVYLNDKRPWIIGYSGGKDSSVVAQLTFQMLLDLPEEKKHKPVYIVSSDTLIENPLILKYLQDNINLINKSAKENKIPLHAFLVKPNSGDTFWTNVIGRGYPTPKSVQYRWCTDRLKIRPSNKFIRNKLEDQDVVILLGVRKSESEARRRRIENREIDGYLLTPHSSLRNNKNMAYVYNPIVDLSTDDVWDILKFEFEDGLSPWNSNNMDLAMLYAKGSGENECPFIESNDNKSTCGNSRFGCWICTVVSEDKSLNAFIDHEKWLSPLRDFRSWLMNIRDKEEYRKKHKRSGAVHKTKDGRITFGPFNFKGRKLILEELLKLQVKIQSNNPLDHKLELITIDELKAIDELWDDEEDLNRNTLVNIYYEITGEKLPWHDYKKPMFDKIALNIISSKCNEHNVNPELLNKLLIETDKYKHFSNLTKLKASIDKTLNQQWIHYDIIEKIEQKSLYIEENGYENN